MLRGSVVIFTSLFSVVFLKRKLKSYHWIGIVLVIGGTAIVGAQSSICPVASSGCTPSSNATLGNILIILAQIIVAVQMVVEEKFISGYNVPALQVVGFEGLFGFGTLTIILIIIYNVPSATLPLSMCAGCCPVPAGTGTAGGGAWNCTNIETCAHFEDPVDAFVMMGNSADISLAVVGNILSIAFFNYFGVSVTKHINASTRMVLDSLRTILIWGFSLIVKWETFCWVQIIGFVILIAGTLIYNALVKVPGLVYEDAAAKVEDSTTTALLAAEGAASVNADGLVHMSIDDGDADDVPALGHLPTSTPTMSKASMMKSR